MFNRYISNKNPSYQKSNRLKIIILILFCLLSACDLKADNITYIGGDNAGDVSQDESETTPLITSTLNPLALPTATDDEILILIATFHLSDDKLLNTEPHHKIYRAIQQQKKELGLTNIKVQVDPTIINAINRTQAEQLGHRYNAALIVWGEDTGIEIVVNFLNLKQPTFTAADVTISETQRTQTIAPDAYASFITQDLPKQLVFLSLFALGQSEILNENFAQAIILIETGIKSLPHSTYFQGLVESHYHLGWLYQQKGELEQAFTYYNYAVDLDPTNFKPYISRGSAYADQGNFVAAIADYDNAILLNPQFALAYYNRGIVYTTQGRFKASVRDYSEAIRLNPQYVEAYINRGTVYHKQQDLVAAMSDYNKAIHLNSKIALVYMNRGNVYADQGNPVAAIMDYNEAIHLRPDYADAYYNRGITYHEQNDLIMAIADYDEAIRLNPKFAKAYVNRGLVHKAQGNLTSARQDWEKALELFTNPQHKANIQGLLDELE